MIREGAALTTGIRRVVLLAVILTLPSGQHASVSAPIDDPFPLRNQLPFHLLFLDQTPRGARLLGPREHRLAFHLTHENTMVGSDAVIAAFVSDDFMTAGGEVTEMRLAMIAAAGAGQTAFFIDGETVRSVLEGAVGIGSRLEFGVELPFLLHSAGRFDGTIDSYHERLGLPDGGRPGFSRYRFVGGYVGDQESVFVAGSPGGFGLGDIVVSTRAAIAHGAGRRPAIAGTLSLKLPTGDPERLEGSGHADYGAGIQISESLGRSAIHGGYAYTRIGGWSLAPKLDLNDGRSLFAAYSFAWSPRNSFISQILRTNGAFPFRAGSDLGRTASEITLGFRHQIRSAARFEWAIIENLSRDHNSPDFGLFFGISFIPPPSGPGR